MKLEDLGKLEATKTEVYNLKDELQKVTNVEKGKQVKNRLNREQLKVRTQQNK